MYEGVDIGPPEIGAQPRLHPAVDAMARFFSYHDHFDPATVVAARRAYYALVSYMDHNLGRVLGALDRSGARDETLVIYTSDHGEMLGNRGLWAKSYLYEDSVGVPMIAAGPGLAAGEVVANPVNLVDIAATIGATLDEGPIGVGTSLVEVASASAATRAGFSEYHDGGSITGSFAVLREQWKYIHHCGFRPELFNLLDDPDELVDLGEDPAFAEVRSECDAALRSVVDPDEANRAALASQETLIERYGGRDALGRFTRFDHTPVPD